MNHENVLFCSFFWSCDNIECEWCSILPQSDFTVYILGGVELSDMVERGWSTDCTVPVVIHRHSWLLTSHARVIAHTVSRARVKFSAFFMQADCELMFSRFVILKLFRSLKNAVVSKVTCIIHVFLLFFVYFLQPCLPGFLCIQHCFICRP
jgi:hypothetical protein